MKGNARSDRSAFVQFLCARASFADMAHVSAIDLLVTGKSASQVHVR
jgi:hypothetical protein